MKIFLFSILFISILGCTNSEPEIDQAEQYPVSSTWIKLTNVFPKPGVELNQNAEVGFNIEYNIAPDLLEMEGFELSVVTQINSNQYAVVKKWILTSRKGFYSFSVLAGELSPYFGSKQIKISSNINQKVSDTKWKPLFKTDVIEYLKE